MYLIDGGSHIDKALTNLAVMGFTGMDGFIGDQLFPVVPVGKQSDKYYIVDPDTYMRIPDAKRAPKASANVIEFKLTSESYFSDNYALATETAFEELGNADLGGAFVRQSNNEFLLDAHARVREQRIANLITSISNVGSGTALTGTDRWSNAGSDPIGDVATATAFMRLNTGLVPNTMAMDFDTHHHLRHHPLIRDYVKYTQAGPVPDSELMSLFNVGRILVARGVYNSAKEGATKSQTGIWGNFATLLHIRPGTGMKTTTFGLGFRWQPAEFPAPMVVERFPHHDRTKKAEVQLMQYFQDEKIVARDLAYTINDTV